MSTRQQVLAMFDRGATVTETAQALGVTKSTVCYHLRRVREPDPRFRRRYDWSAIQRYYDQGHSITQCQERFGFARKSFVDAQARGAIRTRPPAMPIAELLSAPRNRRHIKLRLVAAGLKQDQCEICGIAEWQGRPLSLALHHVNGITDDNRLENLQLLCPNCHSQTDTFAGRNRRRRRITAVGGGPPAA